jgi:hypothetical protein
MHIKLSAINWNLSKLFEPIKMKSHFLKFAYHEEYLYFFLIMCLWLI